MNKQKSGISIGFTGLLLLSFIILKLTKVIDWSWWWVLSPIWIIAALIILALIIAIYADRQVWRKPKQFIPPKRSAFEERIKQAMEKRNNP